MTLYENYIVYPEGDIQEIKHSLSINMVVDINGYPLQIPLSSYKIIAYRIYKKHTTEQRGIVCTKYFLELLNTNELMEFI